MKKTPTVRFQDIVKPDLSTRIQYQADNNTTSVVNLDIYRVDMDKYIVIGTEIEGNTGASITNSIEAFARAVSEHVNSINIHVIESYHWSGETPYYDKVFFEGKGFTQPAWRRLDEGALGRMKQYIIKQREKLNGHAEPA